MKCDEIKPICGACAKKDNLCEYTSSGRRSVKFPASDRAIIETVPELTTQQTTSPVENDDHASTDANPNPTLYEPHGATDSVWTISEADANTIPPAQLDHLSGSHLASIQSPVALQHSSLSPSNPSFAAVRWFGLLASDAARDSSHLSTIANSWANQSLSLDQSGPDGLIQPSSLQRATQVLDSPPASDASHDPTHTSASGGSTLGEEQIWHSREPIELLPSEATLFEHFLHQVSPWVCHYCHACDLNMFGS